MSVKLPSHETVHELPDVLVKEDLHDEGSVDPVYQAKARILNRALQEIGMGRYQVRISTDCLWRLYRFYLVGSIRRCWLWMVRVSTWRYVFGRLWHDLFPCMQRQRLAGKLHGCSSTVRSQLTSHSS